MKELLRRKNDSFHLHLCFWIVNLTNSMKREVIFPVFMFSRSKSTIGNARKCFQVKLLGNFLSVNKMYVDE